MQNKQKLNQHKLNKNVSISDHAFLLKPFSPEKNKKYFNELKTNRLCALVQHIGVIFKASNQLDNVTTGHYF